MESIEPIIRLVKHQLEEILPVEIAAASPPQTEEATDSSYLNLPIPAQVKNSFRAVEQERFPALVIVPVSSEPTEAERLFDDPDEECQVHKHDFLVQLAVVESESEAENLTYILARYCQILRRVVCQFEEGARVQAFADSGIADTDVSIIPGAVFYENRPTNSLMLRTASLEFSAFA